jgi:hypothetical protein
MNCCGTIHEKPFLQVDSSGNYTVRVPSLSTNSSGITWHAASTPGKTIPIREFYIAHPNRDNTTTINAQLAKGKNLLFTPGIYELTEAIRVTRPNTVVMGVGFATAPRQRHCGHDNFRHRRHHYRRPPVRRRF